jgi:alpha-beta hydrolase superfamily lysophospholipase
MEQEKKEGQAGLVYRLWELPSSECVLVLVHGLGAHSARWEALAEFLQKHDISSCAIDLKGFGLTKDLRGHVDSVSIYFDDIRSLCALARKLHPGKKVFCVGESMGALFIFLLALNDPDFCDGIILISPAFKTKLKLTAQDYIKVFWSLVYNPKEQFNLPWTSDLLTRDTGYRKMIDTDIRECHVATSRLLTSIVFAQIRSYVVKKYMKLPVLFLLAGADRVVDSKAAKDIFKSLVASDKQLIEYAGMYHALSIDLEKEKVFQDMLKWVKERI